jgi:hypothetical protein
MGEETVDRAIQPMAWETRLNPKHRQASRLSRQPSLGGELNVGGFWPSHPAQQRRGAQQGAGRKADTRTSSARN